MPANTSEVAVEVIPGVRRMGTAIVNWYLLEDRGRLTAIDSGLAGYAKTLETDVTSVANGLGDIEAVVLTHSDGDHVGMAARMQEAGARILIHADDEATLRDPGPKSGDGSPRHLLEVAWRPAFWRFFGHMARNGGAKHPAVGDVELFADGDELDVPGNPRVVHTPGHTDGHCALHFQRHGALFVGDELCTWNPLTGEQGPGLMPRQFDVSYEGCVESLDRLESLEAEMILSGHGDPWRGRPAEAAAHAKRRASR